MTPKDYVGEKASYDEQGQMIWAVQKDGGLNKFLDLRGWGTIQYMFPTEDEAIAFQDKLGQWVVDAINEKLERENKI